MKKTYEYKNDKYTIIGYLLKDDESKNYKTDITYGVDDYTKWILNINGKNIALTSTECNHPDDKHIIIEDNLMTIITEYEYFKIDLETLKCLANIELGEYIMDLICSLIKYREGFLVECDFELVYIEDDTIKWKFDPYNGCGINNVEILENDIIKFDVLDAYCSKMYTVHLDRDGKWIKKH